MQTIYTFNNKVLKNSANDKWLIKKDIDPYNPLDLPANTIRAKFKSGYTPTMGDTQTLVDSTNNIWDIYKQNNSWLNLFSSCTDLLEVLGANTSNITDMHRMFNGCNSLTTVSLFDTSKVNWTIGMFWDCVSLTSIPLFDTTNLTMMDKMFYDCKKVQNGALALYQQASTKTNPPSHSQTFYNCGRDTQTGAAELAQIPSDWK